MLDPRPESDRGKPAHLHFRCFPLFGSPIVDGTKKAQAGRGYRIQPNTFVQGRHTNLIHHSFDIHADEGTAIVAPVKAVVARAASDRYGGWNITLHAHGPTHRWKLYCGHLSMQVAGVKVGDTVYPGQLLGLVGDSTGVGGRGAHTSSPHLHFNVTEHPSEWTREDKFRVDAGAELYRFLQPTHHGANQYELTRDALTDLRLLVGAGTDSGYAGFIEGLVAQRYRRRITYHLEKED